MVMSSTVLPVILKQVQLICKLQKENETHPNTQGKDGHVVHDYLGKFKSVMNFNRFV